MEPTPEEKETQRRWLWLLPLLALLMSFFCVYSSTYLALSQWPTKITHAQMLAVNQADYGADQSPAQFAPVSNQIILEATKDSLGLSLTPSPVKIDAVNPLPPDTPVQIADIVETPTRELPTAIVTTATHTPRPTSEPDTPTPIPTVAPSATPEIPTATATAKATVAPTLLPANTATATIAPATATFTAVPQPTWTPLPPAPPPPPPPATPTPTPWPTMTAPPPPPPPPATPTASATATATVMASATPTATATATATTPPTDTPTATPIPTETPNPGPCTTNIPSGEPNIGPPNDINAEIGCGDSIIVDLGTDAIVVSGGAEPAFDLVHYENGNPFSWIYLDWVIVEIGTSNTGPWVQVFNWGDNIVDANTNIGQIGYGNFGEPDNQPIPYFFLYGSNSPGIAIDVDAVSPTPGTYQWIRITAPTGGANDVAEVDSIETLP